VIGFLTRCWFLYLGGLLLLCFDLFIDLLCCCCLAGGFGWWIGYSECYCYLFVDVVFVSLLFGCLWCLLTV